MAQQEVDTSFLADLTDPTYKSGTGPIVMIDAGHNNFHTMDGGFMPFLMDPVNFPALYESTRKQQQENEKTQ